MPSFKYYSMTLILYGVCVLGSIFIDNIAVVFEFVGAFGLSLTSFTLPGIMYLRILKDPKALLELETDSQRKWNRFGSYCVIALSVFNMLLVIVKQIVPGDSNDEE